MAKYVAASVFFPYPFNLRLPVDLLSMLPANITPLPTPRLGAQGEVVHINSTPYIIALGTRTPTAIVELGSDGVDEVISVLAKSLISGRRLGYSCFLQ